MTKVLLFCVFLCYDVYDMNNASYFHFGDSQNSVLGALPVYRLIVDGISDRDFSILVVRRSRYCDNS